MLKWSSNWCLYFNKNKCSVLHSGEKDTVATISCLLVKLIIK